MIPKELVQKVEDKILETYLNAQEKFNVIFEIPKLSFDIRGARVAGRANYADNLIKINPSFLIEHPEEMLNRTIGHECVHLICHKLYPNAKQAHGPEWKYLMRSLGLPDTRCHSMVLED